MDRRNFIETCAAGAACLPLAALTPVFAAEYPPHEYAQVLLTDAIGQPLRASQLRPRVNYLFHYPYEVTPVFLLDLGREILPHPVSLPGRDDQYAWSGGVGPRHSIVAYCAICSHELLYPTRDVNYISFRTSRARRGVRRNLIHCCADHSQYDPSNGARVVSGPAPQPLTAVLLRHDAGDDTLTAYATLGYELFESFFEHHAAKLELERGPNAREPANGKARVWQLDRYSRNRMQC